MHKDKNIVIIGAGPVGCYLGQLLKSFGYNTVIIEEHSEVGKPVQCAGIVGKDVFSSTQFPTPKNSILNQIDGAELSYNGSSFTIHRPKVALIIDREKFDKELSKGLNIVFDAKFTDYEKKNGKVIVKTTKGNYEADYLVGADGPNSMVRKKAKLRANMKLYKSMQYRVRMDMPENNLVKVDYIRPFSFFTWMIPEGNGMVRIGTISDRPFRDLEKFIEKNHIKKDIVEKFAGPIPIGTCELANGSVAVVGDAACQLKPITSGGIYYGIKSAEILAEAIKNDSLSLYRRGWDEAFGKEVRLCLMMRNMLDNSPQDVYDKLFSYLKENAHMIEKIGDFENHSSIAWGLAANPSTYGTMGAFFWGQMRRPLNTIKNMMKGLKK